MSNRIKFRHWRKNTAMAVKAIILLYLVEAVEYNMRGHNEGKIITCTDCRKAWESLTYEKVKASQFAGDGRSTISKIIVL